MEYKCIGKSSDKERKENKRDSVKEEEEKKSNRLRIWNGRYKCEFEMKEKTEISRVKTKS